MAVETNVIGGALVLQVQTGVDAGGRAIYANRRYSSIKPAATDQDLYDVGVAVAGLQQHPLTNIIREVDYEIAPVV